MTGAGRPLRFLALVLFGWTALRVLLLWPQAESLEDALRQTLPFPLPATAAVPVLSPPVPAARPLALASAAPVLRPPAASPAAGTALVAMAAGWSPRTFDAERAQLARAALMRFGPASADPPVARWAALAPLAGAPMPVAAGSAWLLARPPTEAPGPELGGAQAGARVTVPLAEGGAVALSGRWSTPTVGRGREAGLGVAWRPGAAPVSLLVERRLAVDGGAGGTAAMAIAGLDPLPLGGGFDLSAYAQAGAIARSGTEGFVDMAVRLDRPAAMIGGVELRAGVAGWGAAQAGARRIDAGPSLVAVVPVGTRRLRVALDWRQQVAGNARPGSGPALSLGSDF